MRFEVKGLGFGVWGVWFDVWVVGCGVWGVGYRPRIGREVLAEREVEVHGPGGGPVRASAHKRRDISQLASAHKRQSLNRC